MNIMSSSQNMVFRLLKAEARNLVSIENHPAKAGCKK